MAETALKVREATLEDMDAITSIEIAARTESDATWVWRFPYRYDLPAEHHYFTKQRHINAMSPESQFHVMVVEGPSNEDPNIIIPIAVASYSFANVPISKGGKATPKGTPPAPSPLTAVDRPDANPARYKAFLDGHAVAKKNVIEDRYGEEYVYLLVLATHPDYQGHGAGRMLVQWGIDWARERGLPLALFATPMGKRLYEKMGFKEVGEMVAKVEGEEMELRSPGMVFEV